MGAKSCRLWLLGLMCGLFALSAQARDADCRSGLRPEISFISFLSLNIAVQPPEPLEIKGKLSLPLRFDFRKRCFVVGSALPAVLVLHGSAGVDSRGDFYARALNAAGIATLEIDMWEARHVSGPDNRPAAPIFTYPDVFAALAFLSAHPNIAPQRIGVLGFSWGGVVSLEAAETLYAGMFGIIKGTKLASKLTAAFVSLSSRRTFPLVTFWYSGLLNYFVPSGGSKWAIEAPYLLRAGAKLGVPVEKTAMAYAYGDMSTNLIQPFWAIPLLSVAKLEFKDILGYEVLAFLLYSIISSVALAFFY